jgi:hypothetical protein
MNWTLPNSVEVRGVIHPIRTDYRCILDILTDLSDPEADGQDRALAVLVGLYSDFDDMPPDHWKDAISEGLRFINCDSGDAPHKAPRLVDWEQDYTLIIAPINRVIGREVRVVEYMHWWTFLAAYSEIGDCTFAQVVRIRDHLARGKPLDKSDREWYRKNRHLVDFKRKYTSADDALMKEWGGA